MTIFKFVIKNDSGKMATVFLQAKDPQDGAQKAVREVEKKYGAEGPWRLTA